MTDMPDGTLYGTITGSVSAFIGDTESDTNDLPDRVPVPTGSTISFEPSISYVIVESSPKRDIIFATPETVMLDDDGGFSVKLVACDSPNLNPSGWYYTVRLNVPGRAALTARVQVHGGQSITLGEAIGAAQPGVATAIVKGDRGDDGHSPVVAMTGDQLVIDGVVVGPHLTGPPGPASKLKVGTVTTGAPGSQAAASLTGAAPNQVLDLTIPQGPKGDTVPAGPVDPQGSAGQPTAFELRGTGSPYGTVTPPAAGTYYTDTAGTNGAWRWIATGTSSSSWVVVYGCTGWRRITTDQPAAWSSLIVLARWEPGILRLIIDGLLDAGASRWDVPLDYSTPSQFFVPLKSAEGWVLPDGRFRIDRTGWEARGQVTIPSPRWPTTLPGTPA